MNRPIIATDFRQWQEIVTAWLFQIESNTIPKVGFPVAGPEHTVCILHLRNLIKYRADKIISLLARGRYMAALMLYEPKWRLKAMNQLRDDSQIGTHGYWKLVRSMWDSLAEIWPYSTEIAAILADADERELMMSPRERARLSCLPDEVVIYRGVGRHWAESGMSWTLSPTVAMTYSAKYGGKSYLMAIVNKADIAALIDIESQFEVVMAAPPASYDRIQIIEEE